MSCRTLPYPPLHACTDLLQAIPVEPEEEAGLPEQAEALFGQDKDKEENIFEGLGEGGVEAAGARGSKLEHEESKKTRRSRDFEMAPRALGCLGLENPLRIAARKIAESAVFEDLVFVCILASTTALAIDNKFIGKGSTLDLILSYSDVVINIVFTIELVLKVSCDDAACAHALVQAPREHAGGG